MLILWGGKLLDNYDNSCSAKHHEQTTDEQAWQIIKARIAKANTGIGLTIDSTQARRQIRERLVNKAIAMNLMNNQA
ncbi:hypothetical protein B0680_09065 [Moraxella pluranimalium]|uniref:Uncharacterized protein n=1 Tax=Moraxella pluranimalium TaxID=470453 RepID=A0A1T0CKS7_9GAMM|nr:hypothetical protein B0680_09065 [Moraxella pluranimalium]